jgi:hypothetical protein
MSDDPEMIALRATVIDGNGYPDDYQVVWHGLSIGRIMKGTGSPNHAPQWWWECNAYGRLPLGGESGAGLISTTARQGSRLHGRGCGSGSSVWQVRRFAADDCSIG